MVEVPVFEPCRNPLKEDSCTAEDEVIKFLVVVSCDEAVRDIIDEAILVLPPMA